MKAKLIYCFILIAIFHCNAQSNADSIIQSKVKPDSTVVELSNGDLLIYKKPKPFSFVLLLPKTLAHSAKLTFRKQSIPTLAAIAGSSLLLISVDQHITDGAQQFGRYIHLDATRSYGGQLALKIGGNKFTVYDVPRNLNSAIYSVGEGLASVVLSGGLFTYGKITRDYRSIQTASQILQVQLAVGVIGQTIKRISGRETAFQATAPGGVWRPFPSFSEFQNHTSVYDAFPSGHLATMMATVTVVSMNYPEKKWIKWVGGSLITLVGFSMINNGVHWAGDYPLALGIGYVTGYATVKMNRLIQHRK